MPNAITVASIPKPARLNRAQRRALALQTFHHRRRFCQARCDLCGDYIPSYYQSQLLNPKWRKEVRAIRQQRRREKSKACPLPRHSKHLTCCFDCHIVQTEAARGIWQQWCGSHQHHPLDRLMRLLRWTGIETDDRLAWRHFYAAKGGGREAEALKEIAACTAGILERHREPEPPQMFARAMDEIRALELSAPVAMPGDDPTDATVELELEIYRLTGVTELTMNDDDWRALHETVTHCLESYARFTG